MDNPWLTVLMPAYNEETCLEGSVSQVVARLSQLQIPSEILIVDDCSTDRTGEIADALAERYRGDGTTTVRVCHHQLNQGIGGGVRTGITEARGQWLILIPADLALDLADMDKYLDATPTADIVVGIRSDRRDYTVFRRLVSLVNIGMIRFLFRLKLHQFQYISMYRLMVLRSMDIQYWHSAFFHAEILIRARDLGYQLTEVKIHYIPRASGSATGANWRLVSRTGRDMLQYWAKWIARHPSGLRATESMPEEATVNEAGDGAAQWNELTSARR